MGRTGAGKEEEEDNVRSVQQRVVTLEIRVNWNYQEGV